MCYRAIALLVVSYEYYNVLHFDQARLIVVTSHQCCMVYDLQIIETFLH